MAHNLVSRQFVALATALLLAPTVVAVERDTVKQSSQRWTSRRPNSISSAVEGEKAVVRDDKSVLFQGDVGWSEPTLHFQFKKATTVRKLRVELLPERDNGRRLSRSRAPFWLFDVKPARKPTKAKASMLDWKSCHCPQQPNADDVANCIDFLSDTGWRPPALTKKQTRYELILELEKPTEFSAGDELQLTFDTGGAPEFGLLARVRVSFPDENPLKSRKK